jgi:hypothetical protein
MKQGWDFSPLCCLRYPNATGLSCFALITFLRDSIVFWIFDPMETGIVFIAGRSVEVEKGFQDVLQERQATFWKS